MRTPLTVKVTTYRAGEPPLTDSYLCTSLDTAVRQVERLAHWTDLQHDLGDATFEITLVVKRRKGDEDVDASRD